MLSSDLTIVSDTDYDPATSSNFIDLNLDIGHWLIDGVLLCGGDATVDVQMRAGLVGGAVSPASGLTFTGPANSDATPVVATVRHTTNPLTSNSARFGTALTATSIAFSGYMEISTAGVLRWSFAQDVANTSPLTVLAGSFLSARKLAQPVQV